MRLLPGLAFVAALAIVSPLGALTETARADEQWFGNYQGKTYRNNWGTYPTGPITTAYCGGGAWGSTHNPYFGVEKRVSLWRDALEHTYSIFWDWVYKGTSTGTASGASDATTNVYHGRCTRAASDHYYHNGSTWIHVGTTSDGF